MNWEAIGAIGEVVGAAGVVISLLYLAYQIRQSRLALKTSASSEAVSSIRALTQAIMDSPDEGLMLMRALKEPDGLSEEEVAWAAQVVHMLLRQFETLHFQSAAGTLDRDLFASYEREFALNLGEPLVRRFWARRGDLYTPAFRTYVDGLMAGLPPSTEEAAAVTDGRRGEGRGSDPTS